VRGSIVAGLWYGPPTRLGRACDDRLPFRRGTLSDTQNQQKLELECLRLASDLTQLGRDTLNPDLRAHCVRMAKLSSDRSSFGDIPVQSVLYH
jgi:hypothetical protein